MRNKKEHSIDTLKAFWDGPKVGFNEDLYNKYLKEKKAYRKKKRKRLMESINLN